MTKIYKFTAITICLLSIQNIYCQNIILPKKGEAIKVFYTKDQPIYSLSVKKECPIQEIEALTGIPTKAIVDVNKNKFKKDYALASTIDIPLNVSKIELKPKQTSSTYLLEYEIKKGETLYSLKQSKLNIDIDDIKALNHLKDNNLKVGQKLKLGYITFKIDTKKVATTETKAVKVNSDVKKVEITKPEIKAVIETGPKKIMVSKPEMAMWDRSSKVTDNLFVLHNLAEIGSVVEITYPMLKRKTKAKVLGRIPVGTYKSDITLFISPGVARELGILDEKSKVIITYPHLQ